MKPLHIKLAILLLLAGTVNVRAQQVWSLDHCLSLAKENNKNLKINLNNIELSIQKQHEVKANFIPQVTAMGEYQYFTHLPYQLFPMNAFNPMVPPGEFAEAQFGVPHNLNGNIQLVAPLFHPLAYGAILSSQIGSELAELQYQKSLEETTYEITTLYYNAQILHHQHSFVDSNLVNTQKLYDNLNLLREQKLATGTDVRKIELNIQQLKLALMNIESKQEQILEAMKLLMGIEQDFQINAEIESFAGHHTDITNNLDLQLVSTKNQFLNSELISIQRSRFLPTLGLVASLGTNGFGYDKKPNRFLKFYPIGFAGLRVTLPIFNGTLPLRQINQKKIEILNSELQYELATEKIEMDLSNAIRQKSVATLTMQVSEKQIDLAKEIYNQTLLQQRNGLAGLTEVILADNALREAQQSYLNAAIEYLKANLDIKKATGSLNN